MAADAASPAERLYDEDFYAWTQLQARAIGKLSRSRPNVAVDLDRVAEEIRDLGKDRRDALRSWTARIMEHLLLLEHSPAGPPRAGWIAEVVTFRKDLRRGLTASLRRDLERQLPALYDDARDSLAQKLPAFGEAEVVLCLPRACPYALDQVIADWWPDTRRDDGAA